MGYNIAIDGPAGAGKSTAAKAIAKAKKFVYFDTGAMYRAVAVYVDSNKIDYNDESSVETILDNINLSLKHENGDQLVILNGEDITSKLRTAEITYIASVVARIAGVRKKLVEIQREVARDCDVVMDGRDIGSVVLPNADLKIYLNAAVETRAKRRFDELVSKGENPVFEEILEDIKDRDNRDVHRENSPMIVAEGSTVIDDSDMTEEEVVELIVSMIK